MVHKKLDTLLRASEANEQDAAGFLERVRAILAGRQQSLNIVQKQKNVLIEKLSKARGQDRLQLMQLGDGASLSSLQQYAKSLLEQIGLLDKEIEKCAAEVERAEVHAELAEQEFVEAQIDRKKVEHLLENKVQQKRLEEEAREEQDVEDTHSGRRRPR